VRFVSADGGVTFARNATLSVSHERARLDSDGVSVLADPQTLSGWVKQGAEPARKVQGFEGVLGSATQDGLSPYLLPVDPDAPCRHRLDVTCRLVGKESVGGRETTRWQLTHGDQDQSWQSSIWVDARLHFVTRVVFLRNVTELRNIVELAPAATLFATP